MYMCRWPNGDLSFVSARNREEAIIQLDEWDNAELAEMRRVENFMVDFRLTDEGELALQSFGEHSLDDIWDHAYPVLAQTKREVDEQPARSANRAIRSAVETERHRLVNKKSVKPAGTELGRSLQAQTGAPAALVNKQVKRIMAEVLEKAPTSGRKQ